jgi:hypothetical protein
MGEVCLDEGNERVPTAPRGNATTGFPARTAFPGNFIASEVRRGPKSHHNVGNPGNVGLIGVVLVSTNKLEYLDRLAARLQVRRLKVIDPKRAQAVEKH